MYVQLEMYYGANQITFEKAKELRKNMTETEKILWQYLRKDKINGLRFRRQHPIDIFIADFYCHKAKLVIEIDGYIHNHQKEYDIGRTEELKKYGLKVIRFTNEEVLKNIEKVVEKIDAEISEKSFKKEPSLPF
jgi:very-short-patch-repair endonuclease